MEEFLPENSFRPRCHNCGHPHRSVCKAACFNCKSKSHVFGDSPAPFRLRPNSIPHTYYGLTGYPDNTWFRWEEDLGEFVAQPRRNLTQAQGKSFDLSARSTITTHLFRSTRRCKDRPRQSPPSPCASSPAGRPATAKNISRKREPSPSPPSPSSSPSPPPPAAAAAPGPASPRQVQNVQAPPNGESRSKRRRRNKKGKGRVEETATTAESVANDESSLPLVNPVTNFPIGGNAGVSIKGAAQRRAQFLKSVAGRSSQDNNSKSRGGHGGTGNKQARPQTQWQKDKAEQEANAERRRTRVLPDIAATSNWRAPRKSPEPPRVPTPEPRDRKYEETFIQRR